MSCTHIYIYSIYVNILSVIISIRIFPNICKLSLWNESNKIWFDLIWFESRDRGTERGKFEVKQVNRLDFQLATVYITLIVIDHLNLSQEHMLSIIWTYHKNVNKPSIDSYCSNSELVLVMLWAHNIHRVKRRKSKARQWGYSAVVPIQCWRQNCITRARIHRRNGVSWNGVRVKNMRQAGHAIGDGERSLRL